MPHLSRPELDAGLAALRRSPADEGPLRLIVRRPAVDGREVLRGATLDTVAGLVGDNWLARGSSRTADRRANPDAQVTVMNARVAALVAGMGTGERGGDEGLDRCALDRRALAGDQLYVDLDLSEANLPVGTRLQVGSAMIEVTAKPHTGCAKFAGRFGRDALQFVNSPIGRRLRLRGLNARIVTGGHVQVGDVVSKVAVGHRAGPLSSA